MLATRIRSLRRLSVLAAVIAAATIAIFRATGPQGPVAIVALPPIVVEPVVSGALDEAMEILRHASTFEGGAVGYGGTVPTVVVAWLTVARSLVPDSLFRSLLHASAPVGQLYALAGLRATNPRLFAETAPNFRTFRPTIPTLFGCIGSSESVPSLVAALARGEWVEGFLRAEPGRYHGSLPWPQN